MATKKETEEQLSLFAQHDATPKTAEIVSPNPVCSTCGGSGWKIVEKDGASGAAKCDCGSLPRKSHIDSTQGFGVLRYRAESQAHPDARVG